MNDNKQNMILRNEGKFKMKWETKWQAEVMKLKQGCCTWAARRLVKRSAFMTFYYCSLGAETRVLLWFIWLAYNCNVVQAAAVCSSERIPDKLLAFVMFHRQADHPPDSTCFRMWLSFDFPGVFFFTFQNRAEHRTTEELWESSLKYSGFPPGGRLSVTNCSFFFVFSLVN